MNQFHVPCLYFNCWDLIWLSDGEGIDRKEGRMACGSVWEKKTPVKSDLPTVSPQTQGGQISQRLLSRQE